MPNPQNPDGPGRTSSFLRRLSPGTSPARTDPPAHPLVNVSTDDDTPTTLSKGRPARHVTDADAAGVRGQVLGHFELVEAVGRGGMATVLRARDRQLNREVALKILPPDMAADPENITRFKQEARAAARLDHENVARVYFCGEDQGLHFIAFEFVEGVNLRALLDQRGRPLPVAEAARYMTQVAAGLAHAAARGVVHRDIKPSNILITPDGKAKIVDMGLARNLEHTVSGGVTQSGVTLGTFDYISPEQALEPRTADVRSDLYSLGCTFYHVLTGQVPVPEGTAAKKLHAHQHVAPLDPRLLNPEVGDEMAAVLAKLMAKDPGKRYQRAEELVERLQLLLPGLERAEAGGAGARAADPEAAARPMASGTLLAGLVTLLLIALVAWLNGPPGDQGVHALPPWAVDSAPRPAPPEPPGPPAPVAIVPRDPPAVPAVGPAEAATVDDLARLLRQPSAHIKLTAKEYDLRPLNAANLGAGGLLFQGRSLVLEAGDPEHPPVLRLTYSPDDAGPNVQWTGLSVRGEAGEPARVRLRGLHFVIDAGKGDRPVAAVAAHGAYALRVEECSFEQEGLEAGASASALVCDGQAGEGDPPTLELSQCFFARGRAAVRLTDRLGVQASNCLFGPHRDLFLLGSSAVPAQADLPRTVLCLEHCSALLDKGTVFHLDEAPACRIKAGHCLFARPAPPAEAGPAAAPAGEVVLVRLSGSRPTPVEYNGLVREGVSLRNGYSNLSALWLDETQRPATQAVTLADCLALKVPLQDAGMLELPEGPWQAPHPLEVLRRGEPAQAFYVDTSQPALRLSPSAGVGPGVLGAEQCAGWGPRYPNPLPPLSDDAHARYRIVDPSPPKGLASLPGTYPSLDQAILGSRAGDIILIRTTGPMIVKQPIVLREAGTRLTVRPFPGYRPTLTLGTTSDVSAAMFRLYNGELHLEDLQFLLKPDRDDDAQVLVAVVGGGQCGLRRCVATLAPDAGSDTSPALIALIDPEGVMKMPAGPRPTPTLALTDCLVRGKGDLLAVRGSRRFDLKADGCVVALQGSLLTVEPSNAKEIDTSAAQMHLERVTTYLSDHFACLKARPGKDDERKTGLVPTQVTCADCLFVPPASGAKAFVHFANLDNDTQSKGLLEWSGRNNVYGDTLEPMIDWQPVEGPAAMVPLKEAGWLKFTREDGTFTKVRFDPPTAAERSWTELQPGDWRAQFPDLKRKPDEGTPRVGAPLGALPQPYDAVK